MHEQLCPRLQLPDLAVTHLRGDSGHFSQMESRSVRPLCLGVCRFHAFGSSYLNILLHFLLETKSHNVALAGLALALETNLVSNSDCLPLFPRVLGMKPCTDTRGFSVLFACFSMQRGGFITAFLS